MKSIYSNKIKALGAFLIFSGITFSQTTAESAADKRVQAGLTTNVGMNLLSLGTTRMEANGLGGNFSIGIVLHSSFKSSKNLGISTGLDFDFATQKTETNAFGLWHMAFSCDPNQPRVSINGGISASFGVAMKLTPQSPSRWLKVLTPSRGLAG